MKSNTALNTFECDVYVINIDKSLEKRVSDHSNLILKCKRPYMVTNEVLWSSSGDDWYCTQTKAHQKLIF